jgi:hypothetical protein
MMTMLIYPVNCGGSYAVYERGWKEPGLKRWFILHMPTGLIVSEHGRKSAAVRLVHSLRAKESR